MDVPTAPETIDQLRERIKELEIEVRVLRSVLPQPYWVPYVPYYPPYWTTVVTEDPYGSFTQTEGTGTEPGPYPTTSK